MTALAERWRPYATLLHDRDGRSSWAGRLTSSAGDWLLLVALLSAAWAASRDVTSVAYVVAARAMARYVVLAVLGPLAARLGRGPLLALDLGRAVTAAVLVLLSGADPLLASVIAAGLSGLLAALSSEARASLMPSFAPRVRLGGLIAVDATIERLAFLVGATAAGAILVSYDAPALLLAAAVSLAVGALLVWRSLDGAMPPPAETAPTTRQRPLSIRRVAMMGGTSFTVAAMAAGMLVALPALVERLGAPAAGLGLPLAAVAVGMVIGPLPVTRLLGHVALPLLLSATVVLVALGLMAIGFIGWLALAAVVLVGLGIVGVTHDVLITVGARRVVSAGQLPATSRALMAVAGGGQVVGALGVGLAVPLLGLEATLVAVAVACILLTGVGLLVGSSEVSASPSDRVAAA